VILVVGHSGWGISAFLNGQVFVQRSRKGIRHQHGIYSLYEISIWVSHVQTTQLPLGPNSGNYHSTFKNLNSLGVEVCKDLVDRVVSQEALLRLVLPRIKVHGDILGRRCLGEQWLPSVQTLCLLDGG
jgi:hypothetical protein